MPKFRLIRPYPSPSSRTHCCHASKTPSWRRIIIADFHRRSGTYLRLIQQASTGLHDLLTDLFSSHPTFLPPTDPNGFVAFALEAICGLGIPAANKALTARKVLERNARFERRSVEENTFIYLSPEARVSLFVFADIGVDRLPPNEEYPPRGHFVAYSRRNARIWAPRLHEGKQADARLPRRPIHVLENGRLQLAIPEELSCRLHDRKTGKLIFVAIRRFCNHSALLAWVVRIVLDALKSRRNVRMEDLGALIQIGYSTGLRNDPSFGIVRNFLSRAAGAAGAELESNRALSSVLIYFWLRAKGIFPEEVISDIEGFYADNDIPRFDPDWPHGQETGGVLELPLGTTPFAFEDVERAPGCAVAVDGYARAVHREVTNHQWAIAWNHVREGLSLLGGHFYLSDYGVEMRSAADTAWAWCPSMWHTTGLSNAHKSTRGWEKFKMQGLAFATPPRLAAVYRKWASKTDLPGKERFEGASRDLREGEDKSSDIYS